MQKIVITSNEVAVLLGYSESYARKVIRNIKKELGKSKKEFITYREFAKYYGFTLDEVLEGLNNKS